MQHKVLNEMFLDNFWYIWNPYFGVHKYIIEDLFNWMCRWEFHFQLQEAAKEIAFNFDLNLVILCKFHQW